MKSTLKDLKKRRSIRKYKPEQITDEELDAILEAGAYAPTAMGTQAVKIVAVQNKTVISKLQQLNAAVLNDPKAKPFFGAPTVVNVLADSARVTPVENGSLVIGNMLNAATALGIGSCWINRAREVFATEQGKAYLKKWGVPEGYIGVGHVILGYPDEEPKAAPRKEGYITKIK
jgi:nitroreductase